MNPAIHDTAQKGFSLAADAYDRGRPSYPLIAVQKLISELRLSKDQWALELGAGTGKLTQLLVENEIKVIATEPVDSMRSKLSNSLPQVKLLSGSAESIPAENQSFDAVIAAQAFHWFRGPEALLEIHRVLKPKGRLGLIWNTYDLTADWLNRVTKIIFPYEGNAPQYRHAKWQEAFQKKTLFTQLNEAHFDFPFPSSVSGYLDLVLSLSYISKLEEALRNKIVAEVREVLINHPALKGRENFEVPMRTDIFWCEKISI